MRTLGIGGGKDVVVEPVAARHLIGHMRRAAGGSRVDELEEGIKERIRFLIRYQAMRSLRVDLAKQIPGEETWRVKQLVCLLLLGCRKPGGGRVMARPLGFIDGGR